MSSSNYKKLFVFVIFLVLCLSVSYAANVTDDSTTDKIDTSVTAAETPSIEKESNLAKQTVKKDKKISKESNRHIPGDPYTFANETLDITGNQYDGHTLTLLDNVNVYSSNNMQLTGTNFIVNGNNVNITGLKIDNNNWNTEAISVTGSNVNIIGNNISLTRTYSGDTKGISIVNATNVTVSENNVNVHAMPQSSGWEYINETDEWIEHMKVSGIKAETSNNVTINNNIVTVTNSTTFGEVSSSADAITLKTCNDSNIENNTVTISGSDYIYGIAISRYSNNIFIYNNTVSLSGTNYICGIQLASSSNSRIKHNIVKGTCTSSLAPLPSLECFAYGIVDLTGRTNVMESEALNNIIEFNDVELDSTIAYAYELSNTENTQILNNNATVRGEFVMGLGIFNSSNSDISSNNFISNGFTTILNASIVEAVPPETTGIKLSGCCDNIQIYYNDILVTNLNDTVDAFCVRDDVNCTNIYVYINTLHASATQLRTGDNAIDLQYSNIIYWDNI